MTKQTVRQKQLDRTRKLQIIKNKKTNECVFVVYVVHGCCPHCYVPRELDAFFFWLGYSNSSVNPILYTLFNEEFRRAFQRILGFKSGADSRKR